MAWVLPEIGIRRVINDGLKALRLNKPAFLDIFNQFAQDELDGEYGAAYVEQIWEWFSTTKIPVIQSWSFNAQRIPCISVHLANESEAEDKIALDDYVGTFNNSEETGGTAFTVMLDLGIHANRGGDHVLWLYYILSYVLFKNKPALLRLGLEMGTFSASDYAKDAEKMGNNIWTRWVRYRCTTQNFWGADPITDITDVNIDTSMGSVPASDVAVTPDVNLQTIDLTANKGFKVSRIGDEDNDEDLTP